MPICALDGIEINYTDHGHGPTLVLVHGYPLDNRIWNDAANLLESRFRVIAPDLRGFGKSTDNQTFTIESLADDVHNFLNTIHALRAFSADCQWADTSRWPSQKNINLIYAGYP